MLETRDYVKQMSESEKHALRSILILVLQHLLSLDYSTGTVRQYNRSRWEREVAAYRSRLSRLLAKHPGLKPDLTGIDLASAYATACRNVLTKVEREGFSLPRSCPYSLEHIVGAEVWRKL